MQSKSSDHSALRSGQDAAAPSTVEGLRVRLESLRSWITGLHNEAPAIRNQAAILINDTLRFLDEKQS